MHEVPMKKYGIQYLKVWKILIKQGFPIGFFVRVDNPEPWFKCSTGRVSILICL